MKCKKSSNSLGDTLQEVAILFIIVGCIASFVFGSVIDSDFSWGTFVIGVICTLITALFIRAFGEVLILLQTSCDQQYEILMHLKGETPVSDNNTETSVEQKENTQDLTVDSADMEETLVTEVEDEDGVEFAFRPDDTLTCPRCHIMQSASHDACSHCGVTFVFRSEQKK